MVEDEEGIEEQQTFFTRHFEKKFFSERTNAMFCKTFFEHALKVYWWWFKVMLSYYSLQLLSLLQLRRTLHPYLATC
jgi:hypothetical protein